MSNLINAIQENNYEEVERLLIAGEDVNQLTDRAGTPIMIALEQQYIDIVKLLIKYKANLNCRDVDGMTVLAHGFMYNDYSVCKLLLESGCKVNNHEGLSDLRHSMMYGFNESYELTNLLIEHGAVANEKQDDAGWTAVIEAVEWGNALGLRALMEHGADMCVTGSKGRDAFMYAFLSIESNDENRIKVVQELLNFGADIYTKDNDGKTIFDYEDEIIHKELLSFIKDYVENEKLKELIEDNDHHAQVLF